MFIVDDSEDGLRISGFTSFNCDELKAIENVSV